MIVEDYTGVPFKTGDRVTVLKHIDWNIHQILAGKKGTVVKSDTILRIRMDDPDIATPAIVNTKNQHNLPSVANNDIGWSILVMVLRKEEEAKEDKSLESYRIDADGFKTNDENWKPGNWLI